MCSSASCRACGRAEGPVCPAVTSSYGHGCLRSAESERLLKSLLFITTLPGEGGMHYRARVFSAPGLIRAVAGSSQHRKVLPYCPSAWPGPGERGSRRQGESWACPSCLIAVAAPCVPSLTPDPRGPSSAGEAVIGAVCPAL